MTEDKRIKKKIFESSSLNAIFLNLGTLIGFFNTYLLVRLISPEEWAIIILALSILNFIVFLTSLIPPGANSTLIYYIPRLLAENEENDEELLSFVYYNYKNRLFFAIFIYISFIIIISLYNFEFQLIQIILILSPIVFCNTFHNLNISILSAFQKFRRLFIINILSLAINTLGLFFIFLFQLGIPLILITYVKLLGIIFTFLVSFLSILPLINIKNRKNLKLKTKQYRKKFNELQKKYGINVIILGLIGQTGVLILNFIYLNSGFILFITYMSICEHILSFILNTSSSKQPVSIFSELNIKQKSYFKFYFVNFLKYSLLISCFLVGVMYFFIEFYIEVIYTTSYFVLIPAIQIFILLSFSRLILRSLGMVAFSTNNTIISVQMIIIQVSINITISIIAVLFNNFTLLIILYIISSYFYSIISLLLVNYYTKLKLKIIVIYKPVLLFLVSFFIALIISSFINFQIFSNMEFLNRFLNSIVKFSIFLFIFYIVIYFTKYITKRDFEKIIEVVPILNSEKKFIRRIVITIQKFFPSNEKDLS
jgi:O-antigen/teichoic acid export membrane protein